MEVILLFHAAVFLSNLHSLLCPSYHLLSCLIQGLCTAAPQHCFCMKDETLYVLRLYVVVGPPLVASVEVVP